MSSSPKELIFEEESRALLSQGVDILADTVGVTLGPKGKSVGMESNFGAPKISNDGAAVAEDIEVKDQYLNMGISMGKEVARKIKEKSGDGTTTGIILLRALVREGVKNIAGGTSPINIKRGIEKATAAIVEDIEKNAHPLKTEEEIEHIATVSASGDREIGKTIRDAVVRAGKKGVITIEEGKGTETTIDIVEGMQFDRGYASPYFCTDTEKLNVEMHKASLLITDKKISSVQDLLPMLQTIAASGGELLIIADDIEGDALSTLVVNKMRGTLKVCAVKAPGFGDHRKAMLEDIAILTGSTVVSEEKGMNLAEADMSILGQVEKALITKEETILIGGRGEENEITKRITQLEKQIEDTESDYDREKLEKRKAKLSGGIAVIHVGAPSEVELKRKKQIFEDSLSATRAAQEMGYIPGGGIALLKARDVTDKLKLSPEEQVGAKIVKKACEAPFRQIVSNAGIDSSLALEKISKGDANVGFNVISEKVENLIEADVIDPAKVPINALIYSSSAAGIILISEVLIGEAPEDQDS